jgi:malonate transporter
MSAALGAIVPIFALILLGWWLRRQAWMPESFWIGAERLVYWVLFPALLCLSIGVVDTAQFPVGRIALALAAAILAMTSIALALGLASRLTPRQLTSVVQGCLRPNIYIGFAAVAALWPGPGAALFALAVAIAIPLVNLIAVVLLTRFGDATAGWIATLRQIALNPIILGCVAGIALSLTGIRLPQPVADTLRLLGQASLPLALLSVGASLDFSLIRGARNALAAASLAKLAVLPALTWAACRWLGVDPLATAVCTLFNALPASPSSYVMARQMGGDHLLMAAILTLQTMLAALTLPVLLSLLT